MTKEKPLSPRKIAAYCQVNFKTVLRWIADGKLKAYQLPGGSNRVHKADLVQFLKDFNMPVPDELAITQRRILIVDDDPLVRELVHAVIESSDVEVECAEDGFEAGFKIIAHKPSMVILDLNMPNVDGFSVARKLKTEPLTQSIKVLVLSGHLEESIKQELEKMGVDAVMEKPFNTDVLASTVRELVAS